MKVFLFNDYLNSIRNDLDEDMDLICEIDPISDFPSGLVYIKGMLSKVCMLKSDSLYVEFVDGIPQSNEVVCSKNITCPHCGSEDSDSWEASDSDDERDCDTCGSTFSYAREFEVTYSSSIVTRNSEITTLK